MPVAEWGQEGEAPAHPHIWNCTVALVWRLVEPLPHLPRAGQGEACGQVAEVIR